MALVRPEDAEDELTEEMREAARAELAAREEAQRHIEEIKQALADLGVHPSVRSRQDDTEEIQRLRNELRMWRAREREEIPPAHATSRRG